MKNYLRLGGSAALLTYLAWRTDWRQVTEAFAHVRWAFWLLAFVLYCGTQVVSGIRWRLFARPLGFERSLGHYVAYYFIGMFFNLFLPTSVGGDVVRVWYLDGKSGRRSAAFLSVILDRGSGLLMLVALACVGTITSPIKLPPQVVWSVGALAVAAAVGVGCLPLALRWLGTESRSPSEASASPLLRFGLERSRSGQVDLVRRCLRDPGLLLVTTLLSVVVQSANVVLVWLIGWGMGAPIPASYYWVLVPVVTLVTLLPISLNGMGVREGATVLLLAPVGIASATALSLAWLWFATFTAASLVGAGFYALGRFRRPEVRRDDDAIGDHPDQGRAGQPAAAA